MSEAKRQYLRKCEDDFSFFSSNEVNIRPRKRTGGGLVKLGLNACQSYVEQVRQKIADERRPARLLILKARQWGCSTWAQAVAMHRSRFVPFHRALVIGNRADTTRNLMAMNRIMYENFSPAVLDGWERTIQQTDYRYEWGNGSQLIIDTAGQPDAARSWSGDMIHGTEVGMWPHGEEVISGLLPTISADPNTLVVFETTVKGAQGIFWELWESSKEDRFSSWERVFVPWDMHEEYQDELDPDLHELGQKAAAGDQDAMDEIQWLTEREREWLLTGKLTLNQVHWRRRTIATDYKGREEDFQHEYPMTEEDAFRSASLGFLTDVGHRIQTNNEHSNPRKYDVFIEDTPICDHVPGGGEVDPLVECIKATCEERPEPQEYEKGWVHVYEEPEEGKYYVIGCDPSEGTGNDNAAFAIRCEGKIVAVGYRNDLSTDTLAIYLDSIGRWYNNATMQLERLGGGMAVINTLLRLNYPRLYATEAFDASGQTSGARIGFHPTQENNRSLIAMFRHEVNNGIITIQSSRLLQECVWVKRMPRKTDAGGISFDWKCPGKGRKIYGGERISDDLFRAAALTVMPSRDTEWIDSIMAEEADLRDPEKRTAGSEHLDYHNPLLRGEEEYKPRVRVDEQTGAMYDANEVYPDMDDDDDWIPLP